MARSRNQTLPGSVHSVSAATCHGRVVLGGWSFAGLRNHSRWWTNPGCSLPESKQGSTRVPMSPLMSALKLFQFSPFLVFCSSLPPCLCSSSSRLLRMAGRLRSQYEALRWILSDTSQYVRDWFHIQELIMVSEGLKSNFEVMTSDVSSPQRMEFLAFGQLCLCVVWRTSFWCGYFLLFACFHHVVHQIIFKWFLCREFKFFVLCVWTGSFLLISVALHWGQVHQTFVSPRDRSPHMGERWRVQWRTIWVTHLADRTESVPLLSTEFAVHQVQTSTTRAKRLRILPTSAYELWDDFTDQQVQECTSDLVAGALQPAATPRQRANCTDASQCLAKLCNTVEYVVELAKRVDHNDLWTSKVSPNLHPAHSLAGYAEPMADTTGTQPTVFPIPGSRQKEKEEPTLPLPKP